jgi:acetyltransferase-like isoleucine patch superfamily enzyme
MYESRIEGTIAADELIVGKGVVIEHGVVIAGKTGKARRVVLGDFCYIGRETRILVPEFRLGDYSKLHAFSFLHGVQPLQIGRNCWIGGNVVLDSMGGLDIDDNVCVGAQSQLWTHFQFGDIVEGCRFHSRRRMRVGRDAWFSGHCHVSPVAVGERSMALGGSVITHDMLPNHIYGGVPAQDLTDKLGTQFEPRTVDDKAARLQKLIDEFCGRHPQFRGRLAVIRSAAEKRPGVTCFNVADRTYTKNLDEAEVAFLKEHVPLVKFLPEGEPRFISLPEERG